MKGTVDARLKTAIAREESARELYYQMCEFGSDRSRLLWRILFEEDVSDKEHLLELIFEYGSELREKDYFGRAIFIRLFDWLKVDFNDFDIETRMYQMMNMNGRLV